MQWIELHDVGFGECAVIGGRKQEIVMIDCGSLNQRLHTGCLFRDYVADLQKKYEEASERSFVLTHFHKDHYCGLPLLLQGSPYYFDRIYVPCCPTNAQGTPLFLELTIYIDAFVTGPGSETVRMNAANLRFFRKICQLNGTEGIFTLQAGDILEFDQTDYQVLWPPKTNYPFSKELEELVAQADRILRASGDPCVASFLQLKQELCQAYVRCMEAFAYQTQADAAERAACVTDLEILVEELNALLPRIHAMAIGRQVRQLLCDQARVRAVGTEINSSSIILASDTILLTGDATPETMERIAPQLQEQYWLVKAPHHGTESSWWPGFSEMGITHLLISNGIARSGGKISKNYGLMNTLCHCTGADHCDYYEEFGQCCNVQLYCPLCKSVDTIPTQCKQNVCNIYVHSQFPTHPCQCNWKLKK